MKFTEISAKSGLNIEKVRRITMNLNHKIQGGSLSLNIGYQVSKLFLDPW